MTPPALHIYTPTRATRARTRLALHKLEVPVAEFRDPDDIDAFIRSSQVRRLELWVDCIPDEFSQHSRPAELMGLFVRAHDCRTVVCTELAHPDWLDHVAAVALFNNLPDQDWNEPVCPRCRCDATVRTEEGLHWCRRHATRAWEPIEHREGVAWQEQRLVG